IFSRLLIMHLLLCCATLVNAQSRTVSGKVISAEEGAPLQQVTVLVKGTNTTTHTNANGNFSIAVPGNKAVLIFYYVNYTTKEVPVGDSSTLQVTMELKNESLGEVVVVGYGTVKKSDLTGSVVSLKSKDLTPGAN